MDYKPKRRRHRHGWQGFTFFGGALDCPDTGSTMADDQALSQAEVSTSFPLSHTKTGDIVLVVGFTVAKDGLERLVSMGITRGAQLEVTNCTSGGSIMVAIDNTRLGLGAGIANNILVRRSGMSNSLFLNPSSQQEVLQSLSSQQLNQETPMQTRLHLRELPVGSRGRITGYGQGSDSYRQKLLAMGLTPGAEFTIIRQAPLGDPVELQVRGFQLSLRKVEADALIVEAVDHA
ncbi:MAG: FeoA family protein [Cyanobacteria bacterium P01_D01_bin.56]